MFSRDTVDERGKHSARETAEVNPRNESREIRANKEGKITVNGLVLYDN